MSERAINYGKTVPKQVCRFEAGLWPSACCWPLRLIAYCCAVCAPTSHLMPACQNDVRSAQLLPWLGPACLLQFMRVFSHELLLVHEREEEDEKDGGKEKGGDKDTASPGDVHVRLSPLEYQCAVARAVPVSRSCCL